MVVTNEARSAIIGRELPVFDVEVGRDQLRLFAQVVGLTEPVYRDVGAARATGYPDLLVPPTYLFSLELQRPDPYGVVRELGFKESQMLHGEQEFDYRTPAYAGDLLSFRPRIADCFEKKDGALVFLVRETEVTRGDSAIATLRNTAVLRAAS